MYIITTTTVTTKTSVYKTVTFKQLQTCSASCAHVTDLVLGLELGTCRRRVTTACTSSLSLSSSIAIDLCAGRDLVSGTSETLQLTYQLASRVKVAS